MMFLVFFWTAALVLVYTFAIFPALVIMRGMLRPAPYRNDAPDRLPVSVIIAAHNEAGVIGDKLENILAADYPTDLLEVLVVSDGSTDGTQEAVERYADAGVKLLALPRQGKIAALNAVVPTATGEVLVFTDANSMFAPESLRNLLRPFSDPRIGGVAGNQVYSKAVGKAITAAGECAYWNYDRQLKLYESRAGNSVSATGAIYAIRRSLFLPVPPAVTDDFAISTGVIAQGYRLVFAADAVAVEPVASGNREFSRKVRVMTRGFRGLIERRELLNPLRHGFYAVQLFSHKALRRLLVLPLAVLLPVSWLLWDAGWFYRAAALAQAAFYGCAVAGWLLHRTRASRLKLLSIPYYFCMVNIAAAVALFNTLAGRRIDHWSTGRETPSMGAPVEGQLTT